MMRESSYLLRAVFCRKARGVKGIPCLLAVAAEVVPDLGVIAGKVESKNALLSHENQSPGQTGSAFVNCLSQFANCKPGMQVRITETILYKFQGG